MKITAIKSIDYLANRILNVGDTISKSELGDRIARLLQSRNLVTVQVESKMLPEQPSNKAVHTAQNKSNRKTGRKKPIK